MKKLFLIFCMLMAACQQVEQLEDYDTETETATVQEEDTSFVETVRLFDNCGEQECRIAEQSTCLNEHTLRRTKFIPCRFEIDTEGTVGSPVDTDSDVFWCYCENDTRMYYPAREDTYCEKSCLVNGTGFDMCLEHYENLSPENQARVHPADITWSTYRPNFVWWLEKEQRDG